MNIDHEMLQNRQEFEAAVRDLEMLPDDEPKVRRLQEIATSAILKRIGRFSSALLEKELLKIGQNRRIPLPPAKTGNGFLHVLTKSCRTGGHTRVVERWIEFSPKNQRHSVILLSQADENAISATLRESVKMRRGDFLNLSVIGSLLNKAILLRQTASFYEKIILYTHMDDIVPVIAFGTEEFQRPILYFNHADHDFWVGVSIADCVVNWRKTGQKLCETERHTGATGFLPLPVKSGTNVSPDRMTALKTQWKIADDAIILMTPAAPYKLVRLEQYDFLNFVRKVLITIPNAVYMIPGLSPETEPWRELSVQMQGRVILPGEIPHHELDPYLALADMVIDSFPISSFTSVFDVARYGKPALSLRTPVNALETFEKAGIYRDTPEELLRSIIPVLHDHGGEKSTLYRILEQDHFQDGFSARLKDLLGKIPKRHRIHSFEDDPNRTITEFERFVFKTPYRIS